MCSVTCICTAEGACQLTSRPFTPAIAAYLPACLSGSACQDGRLQRHPYTRDAAHHHRQGRLLWTHGEAIEGQQGVLLFVRPGEGGVFLLLCHVDSIHDPGGGASATDVRQQATATCLLHCLPKTLTACLDHSLHLFDVIMNPAGQPCRALLPCSRTWWPGAAAKGAHV